MPDVRFDDYYAIIPHLADAHILLMKSESGWTLPKATVPLSPHDGRWRDAFRVNAAFYQRLGITVNVLECLFVSPFPAVGQSGSSVFVLSNHDAAWTVPPDGAWISHDMLDKLPLTIPEHRLLLERWFIKEMESLDEGLPWTRDGWFEEASAWIHAQLQRHSLVATGPVEQTRSWFISSILRVSTTTGDVYFKAVPPMDVHEPLLTQMLTAQFPTFVPQVLAVHEEHRWLLMKAAPGEKMPLDANPFDYLPRWKTLLQAYARMQHDYTQHTEQLLALGCHDWRLEVLAEQIAPFFAELPVLLQGAQNPLTEEEQEHLQQIIPRLKSSCVELAHLGIPASLHHGDFHRGNIIVNETSCTLLDWSGFVGVTHPFLSLWVPLSDWDKPAQKILCESYLEVWKDAAPLEQLRSALALAHPLATLCGALGHRYQINHAYTALLWDILGEQQHLLDCLRCLFELIDQQ
jgi:Phosphotransferase enzyme family